MITNRRMSRRPPASIWEEIQLALARYTHPNEVGIFAVIRNPLADQLLVGELRGARVNDFLAPAVAVAPEDNPVKLSAVSRGISEGKNHRLAVSQSALGCSPDLIGD